ncbi:cyclin-P [Aulostomus maculatus]
MAWTGFCDSTALLDLHKVDERRAPLRAWANVCGPKDRWQPADAEESRVAPVKGAPDNKGVMDRLSVQTRNGNIAGNHGDSRTCSAGGCISAKAERRQEELWNLNHRSLHELQGLLVPGLLRREVEMALEKLDFIWDRTYAWDIFLDMMRTQTWNSLPDADLPQNFTDSTRAVLVDWVIQVHEGMRFQEETLYLAVHLLNRCLRQLQVTLANLQLLGMVCLFIAAKREESLLPEVSTLCFLMDHTYTKHQLLRMERKVLCGLKFELSYCPPLHFLLLLATVARCSAKVVWMARYLLELSLLEGPCVVFLPLQLAGAALCLARRVLQEPPTPEGEAAWCLASSIHINSETALLKIMHVMARAAAKAHIQETRATFVKFASPEAMNVSRHPALKNTSALLGLCT